MQPSEYSNFWCEKMIERLVECGVERFFVASGSRSMPLICAIAQNNHAKIIWGIDERSLGFMAQGYSKITRRTSVVVVTSGTALANLAPAVCEAFNSEVPLLIISADRPFELRDCGANQTIKQADFFLGHTKKSFDLAPPSSDVPIAKCQTIFSQALQCTQGISRGPVHINVQLRDLAQAGSKSVNADLSQVFLDQKIKHHDLAKILSNKRGLIVVGELAPQGPQENILRLSKKLKWPVYADITSNMRLCRDENILHHCEILLSNKKFVECLDVDVVIMFGGRVVSKRYWQFIEEQNNTQLIRVSESPKCLDQSGKFCELVVDDVTQLIHDVVSSPDLVADKKDFSEARRYNHDATTYVKDFLERSDSNEAWYATRLAAQIIEPVNFFVSASMPIRDLDFFAQPLGAGASTNATPIAIYANRGVSGIDGVISSAIGAGIDGAVPTVLLIGDLAFVHDTNALMLLAQSPLPLLVVVINNGGGGIFHFLPIAKKPALLSPYFDTPNQTKLSLLCAAHGVDHTKIRDHFHFDEMVKDFFALKKSMVLEVSIDKQKNISAHQDIMARIKSML